MNTFAPLWSGLVDSSIWDEPDSVFRVFMAMMSLKDADHVVRYDDYRLARRIHMEPAVVKEAIKVLLEPDKRRPDQEHEGRRIRKVDDGWLVINGEKYRAMIQEEMRKARNRKAQRAWRERQAQLRQTASRSKPLPGEVSAVKAAANGHPEVAEQIALERVAEEVEPDLDMPL